MIQGIDHIAIAVHSLEESIPFYRDSLGLEFLGKEEVPEQKVRVAFFQAGTSRIELLEPSSEESPISKFLETRGPGLHHLAFATDRLQERLDDLKRRGVRLIDERVKRGAEGKEIAFLHPKASGGVLYELCSEGEHHD